MQGQSLLLIKTKNQSKKYFDFLYEISLAVNKTVARAGVGFVAQGDFHAQCLSDCELVHVFIAAVAFFSACNLSIVACNRDIIYLNFSLNCNWCVYVD